MGFKNKTMDLFDDTIIGIESNGDSYDKDATLEEAYIDGTMSTSGSFSFSIISKTYKPPSTSNISNISPLNREHNAFPIDTVYLQ